MIFSLGCRNKSEREEKSWVGGNVQGCGQGEGEGVAEKRCSLLTSPACSTHAAKETDVWGGKHKRKPPSSSTPLVGHLLQGWSLGLDLNFRPALRGKLLWPTVGWLPLAEVLVCCSLHIELALRSHPLSRSVLVTPSECCHHRGRVSQP